MGDLKDYITTRHAAELLGVATRTLQKYIEQGRLAATKIDTRYFIHMDDLRAFRKPRIGRPKG